MRLSESLRRGIMETFAGGIINKFKIKRRRVTLFFEDILAEYIKECEEQGYKKEMREIGELWGRLEAKTFIPEPIKMLPLPLFSKVMNMIWTNLGVLENIDITTNGVITVTTKKEAITRCIGANDLAIGFYKGTLEALTNSSIQLLGLEQNKESCNYKFISQKAAVSINGRSRHAYKKLNEIKPINGYSLKDALRRKIFTLNGNKIYFRERYIQPMENTIFHILGEYNILPEKMTEISYKFFKEIIKEETNKREKLSLLRTLFQIMGWGIIKIVIKGKGNILIEIQNPPHGLLLKDNWEYIIRTFLGYLWLVDKRLKITKVKKTETYISIEYAT